MRRLDAFAVVLAKILAVGDTHERIVSDIVARRHEARIVGCNDRELKAVGEFEQPGFGLEFRLCAVPGDLDIAAARKGGGEGRQLRACVTHPAFQNVPGDFALGAAGEQDQTVGFFEQQSPVKLGHTVRRIQVGARRQVHQPLIASLVLGVERTAGRFGFRRSVRDIEAAGHDRLNTGLGELGRQLECAKQVVPIRDRRSGHEMLLAPFGDVRRRDHALEQRIARADRQWDESRTAHLAYP